MSTPSPLAQAKSLAGTKSDLVEKVKALATEAFWIDRLASEQSWKHLSNAKLLRLPRGLSEAHTRFTPRAENIEAIPAATAHGRDGDYKKALEKHPLPRLLDALQSAERRQKKAAGKKAS